MINKETILLFFLLSLGWTVAAVGQQNNDCLECHAKEGFKVKRGDREISLSVNAELFAKSVHADLECVSCHTELSSVKKYPHPVSLARVNCSVCHDDSSAAIKTYWGSTHGELVIKGDPNAPRCQDCHGNHAILPLADRNSAISPFNIPSMCAQCHAQGAAVARAYDIPEEKVVERYKESIHGEGLLKKGLLVTAVCTSCHSGHNILPHTDPLSPIFKDNVVKTCMKCHGLIEATHRKVIGGQLWEESGVVPICVECHSPHEARKVFYDTNMSNADCLRCHSEAKIAASNDGRSLYVKPEEHLGSVHGRHGVACAQCHTGVTPSKSRACETIKEKVNCAVCHESQVGDYKRGRHGQLHGAGDPNAPYCTECHGRHDTLEHDIHEGMDSLLEVRIREGATYSRNIPQLCARCHREGAVAAVRYLGPEQQIVQHYRESIHGKGLLKSGLTVTATCTSCHSPHKELPKSDPESSVNANNIAQTCGQCHDGIYEQYQHSVHSPVGNPGYERRRLPGEAAMPDFPRCNDCHTAHTVGRTDLPAFKLGIMNQCGKCHVEVTKTYFETYHGKASALGDTTRAKCYDCHGAHDILRPDNPASHLSRENIVLTCGKCHPGSHRRFAGYLTHATHHDPKKYPALFYTFWGMTTLLVGTFAFFGVHTLAWLPRSWKLRQEIRAELPPERPDAKMFIRFPAFHRKMHIVVILSFFGLAITGMMLKFSYTGWALILSKVLGGMQVAGWIHRVCALLTFGYFGAHLWFIWTRYRQSKKTVWRFLFDKDSMVPNVTDFREFWQTIKWFLGKGPRPRYGKWTYWEKFDYFAVFWGVAVIGVSGLMLWFPELFTKFLPGWIINVASIIHSDEALLAAGFIFTIHFFNTHFRPEKFPMDTIIFTGRMTVEELQHERPRWYEELEAKGELAEHLGEPPSPLFTRWVKIFGMTALFVGIVLVLLIIYAMLYSYH